MEEFKDAEEIKKLFEALLGSEVTIKDNIETTEENVFAIFIKKLEESNAIENKIFEEGGIDLAKVVDPLWFVLEHTFKILYGEEATELIMWYIYDRLNPDGTVIPIEDENGKQYIFNTPEDLWQYLKFNFPTEEDENDEEDLDF